MHIPITQTKAWADLQADFNKSSFLQERKNHQFLAIVESTPIGKYLYVPYGPVYTNQKALTAALKSLETYAKMNQAFFIRIEPQHSDFASYAPKNAKKSTDLNPKETWQLDITGSDDDFKSRLPSRLLRYHRTAAKKGITITTSHNPDDIHYLLDLQKALAAKKGINTFSEDYLKTELAQPFSTLYLLKKDDTVIAAGLVFDDDHTRYNLQGAQTEEGRKLHATGILTIQLILDAREKHLKIFDFWGIAPENAPKNHPWAGFTAFKKTFQGQEVDYAGTYDLVLNPGKYRRYRLLRYLNRLRRHL